MAADFTVATPSPPQAPKPVPPPGLLLRRPLRPLLARFTAVSPLTDGQPTPTQDAGGAVSSTCNLSQTTVRRGAIELPSSMVVCREVFYEEALQHMRQQKTNGVVKMYNDPAAAKPAGGLGNVKPRYLASSAVKPPSRGGLPLQRRSHATDRARKKVVTPTVFHLSVVEAITTTEVTSSDGEVHRIPLSSWLVLAPGWSLQPGGEPMLVQLEEQAGGGFISGLNQSHFQPLSEDRLNSRAVEACFKRATQGTSVISLRHAAFLLKSYGQRETRPVNPMSRSAELPRLKELTFSEDEVSSRLQRAELLMSFRIESARKHRDKRGSLFSHELPEFPGEETTWEMTYKPGRESQLQRGHRAWEEFNAFAKHRWGNPVRLWFEIDPEESMRVGQRQFARVCEDMGFRGDLPALWRHLDRDGSGNVALQEIDNSTAVLLADLKVLLDEQFDGSVSKALKVLDDNRSNRITKNEFVTSLKKLGFRGPAGRVFGLLQRRPCGFITGEDLGFLEKWQPPLFLLSKPDPEGMQRLTTELRHKYSNMLKAWLKFLDRKREMRITWKSWCLALERFIRHSPAGKCNVPNSEAHFAGLWREMDKVCNGWIALRQFDVGSAVILEKVKLWLDDHNGGCVAKGLLAASRRGGGPEVPRDQPAQASKNSVRAILRKEAKLSKSEAGDLCEGLDIKDGAPVTESDLKFLERWDLASELQILHVTHRKAVCPSHHSVCRMITTLEQY